MSDRQAWMVRSIAVLLVAVAAVITPGFGTAWASRGGTPGPNEGPFNPGSNTQSNHCISPPPFNLDLNVLYGISEQLVIPFCGPVSAGEFWTPGSVWIVNTTFDSTPPGFVPAGATPLDDFLAKFVSAKYISTLA